MQILRPAVALLLLTVVTIAVIRVPEPAVSAVRSATEPRTDDNAVMQMSSPGHELAAKVHASTGPLLESGGSVSRTRPAGTLELGPHRPQPTAEFQSAFLSPLVSDCDAIPGQMVREVARSREIHGGTARTGSHHAEDAP
jgi:hypothetical protein